MPSKILAKIFWLFAFFCFLLLIQVGGDDSKPVAEKNTSTGPDKIKQKQFPQFYSAYLKVVNSTEEEQKLIAIKQTLNFAKQEGFADKKILHNLHIMEADIHHSRWHIIYALESYKTAQTLIFDQRVASRINELRKHLGHYDKERGLYDEYIATKHSGPAKTLSGKVLVAYVFVDDGIKTRWSNKTKLRTQQTLSLVQQWKQEKAKNYGVDDLSFVNKTFVARRNPQLKSPKGVTFESSGKEIEQFVSSIANSLGEKSIGDFIEKQTRKHNADQGVVILHTDLDQRSFARRCGYTHKQKQFINGRYQTRFFSECKNEYVMLMEKVKRNRWDKMHYAQAHEMMHVFGAADLYNIKTASNFAVTDIMNFQSKNLIHSNIEPITAYAIGWQDELPETPFKILER